MTQTMKKILLGGGIILMYYMNYLASATETLGVKLSQLGQIFPFSFMPPAWMFMVSWGLIFVGLLAWYILLISKKQSQEYFHPLAQWVGVSIIANILRLLATGQQYYVLSVIIIAGLCYSIYRVLDYLKSYKKQNTRGWHSRGVYLGWTTVATMTIGISQVLYNYAPTVALQHVWGYIALIVGGITSIAIYAKLKNIIALIWSFFVLIVAGYTLFIR